MSIKASVLRWAKNLPSGDLVLPRPRTYYVIRTDKPNLTRPWPWKRALPPGCIRRFNHCEFPAPKIQAWSGCDTLQFETPIKRTVIRAQHIPGTDIFVEV